MASATGIPENVANAGRGEQEPLLGRAGDASQQEGKPLYYNLVLGELANNCARYRELTQICLGTGTIAQAGLLIV